MLVDTNPGTAGSVYTASLGADRFGVDAPKWDARDSSAALRVQEALTGRTGLSVFHDASDVTVDVSHSDVLVSQVIAAGNPQWDLHRSQVGDAHRWTHGLPGPTGDLAFAEGIWRSWVTRARRPRMPAQGTVRVNGRIVIRDSIEVWLDGAATSPLTTGNNATVTLAYDLNAHTYRVTPILPATVDVLVRELDTGRSVHQSVTGATTLTAT
jgi:hypothetical protein